ncbi:Crp/Fnr family transcriptional regulator [Stappia sp. 28M-7]|jgi:CRP-like cAMP-binding protein|uniref:Crp/Fnr family transcriptional regulator n=1 Tax=Stappia sp. 28M-7 TaxID=2762596 RepID=UPI000E75049A|nr:Crp/Fnr family transcriptional regulator [Stappia sp. 28M-7]MBC2859642.1 Crp/Fnr family transcriptional regulator [Stappia sp. 28M-7]
MPPAQLDRSLIRDLTIFQSMSEEDLDAVLAMAVSRRYAIGATVFAQGEPASEFFALLHGRLKVVQTTPDGQQVVVRHVSPGDIFGIARAMRRTDYPATASAVVDSLALVWPSSQWDSFIARSPVLAMNALQTVGQRLQDAHTRIRELSTEEVERRVAHALLRLVNQAGRKTEDGILIDFPVTRQDIAEMTGTTLHTVSRVMTSWEAQGLVSSARKKVVVCNAHKLFMLAERSTD